MTTDRFYQHRPRTMIPVTVQPNDGQRFIRFRSSDRPADDFGNRMSLRMREFEDECRRWREEAFRNSSMDLNGFPHSSMLSSRPRLFMDFPDFPEFGSVDWPSFRGPALGSGLSQNAGMHRSFVEEDNDGRKRYKVQFDIGDFRPEELNVRVEGRMLIVKGDRQVKVGHATESKQFNRELTIPEFVDAKNIQSYLTDDGQLILEAPVLLDRVYNNQAGATPISSSTSNRVVDTTFTGGRPTSSSLGFNHNNHVSTGFTHSNPVSTGFSYNPVSTDFGNNQLSTGFGNNQSSAYSSTSSASSFRQESTGLRDAGSFSRNSPLRDQYSSTASSTSTLIGGNGIGGHNNQISSGFSTNVARPEQYSFDRANGSKTASYTFDLHQFAPEDIAIQVNDTMLKVTAVKQERDARNSSQREYRREIGLPDGADPKNLTNSLGADGVLTIQIPVRDHRPPLTPTLRSQQFNLPTNVSTGGSLAEGEQQLKLTFDLSGYKPDDVTVKVNDNVLKVQAAHAENTPGNQISREYMREYVLPDWVDADKLRAKMSEDSTLTVEVPIPHDRVSSLNRQINITH